jgi:hypothetical protein
VCRALALFGVFAVVLTLAGCSSASPRCPTTRRITPVSASVKEPTIQQSSPAISALARRYEPTVRITALDRFWPVSVAAVLDERGNYGNRVSLLASKTIITGAPTLADLKPSDNPAAYLAYPAGQSDKAAQMDAFLRGLGMSAAAITRWPARIAHTEQKSATIYFFDAGTGCSFPGADTTDDTALEYWFFYPYNYYPVSVDTSGMQADPLHTDEADIDFHEGDWEHVTVLVQDHDGRSLPRYIWMARHDTEGRLLAWDQVAHDVSGHPVVYPAFGGHPSYPDCGSHPRAIMAEALYDYVVCGTGLVSLSAESTRLVDLAKVSWSCWPGYFGTTQGTNASNATQDPTNAILAVPPRSPLRQGENSRPCARAPSGAP